MSTNSFPRVESLKSLAVTIEDVQRAMPSIYDQYKSLVMPSEVAPEFHPFSFLGMLSATASDFVYFREGDDNIYCNLWVLMVGNTSIPRKSTAVRPSVRILRLIPWVTQLASRGSPEGFLFSIRDAKGKGFLYHGELGTVLAAMKKDYMSGLADELCEYYDPPSAPIVRRLTGYEQDEKVEPRAISWVAATTLSSLNEFMTHHRIGSGFLPRWCIVLGDTVPASVPFRPAKDPKVFSEFAQDLQQRFEQFKTGQEVKFSEEAKATFSEWYNEIRARYAANEFVSAFRTRIVEATKKIAVLFCITEESCAESVPQSTMSRAIVLGNFLLANAERLLESELALSYDEKQLQRVRAAIERIKGAGKPITQREVLRHTGMRKDRLKLYWETLQERGEL